MFQEGFDGFRLPVFDGVLLQLLSQHGQIVIVAQARLELLQLLFTALERLGGHFAQQPYVIPLIFHRLTPGVIPVRFRMLRRRFHRLAPAPVSFLQSGCYGFQGFSG